MKRQLLIPIVALLATSLSYAQIPSGYYDNAEGETGDALKDSLNNIISGHTEYPYNSSNTDVWDILKAADYDPDTTDNVILMYTGWSVDAAQEYNNGAGWTREHIWAKQHGDFGTTMGPGTDCHNLRPADVSVNSAKNNRWFEESPDEYKDDSGYIGSADSSTGCYWSDTDWYWEPRDAVKGDVARTLFYMATRYEGENGEPDLEVIDSIPSNNNTTDPIHARLSTLLQWHNDDPVDDYERRRHDTIYAYQGNRNPFIDHPEWVCEIWGGVCLAAGKTETFDNFTETTSYNTDSFTGENDIEWSYTSCKGTPTIEGNSAVLGKGYSPNAGLVAEGIPGGCGTLTFEYMQAYSTAVDFDVYVNGEMIGTVDSSVQSEAITASFTVNVIGDFDLQIVQSGTSAGQVTIDNVNWTPYQTTTVETFDNFSEGSSYATDSFYGVDSVHWHYVSTKGNVTMTGNAATLGKGYSPDAELYTDTIAGGISELTIDYMQPYTTTVNFDIYVNGTLVDNISSSTQNVDTTTETYSVYEGGNFVLRIVQRASSSGQVAIDNITWKSGGQPADPGLVVETFDNCTVGGTYSDGNFVGDNGNTWNWVECRNEYSYGIDGNGLMLRDASNSSRLYSDDIPGGIDTLEFDLKKGYTASGKRQVEVFLNSTSVDTTTGFDDTNTHHFTFTGLATTGDFDLSIENTTANQVVIDNIRWTAYSGGAKRKLIAAVEKEMAVSVYPNPTSGYLFVKPMGVDGEPIQLQLFNFSGQLVRSTQLAAGQQGQVDIKALPDGVYILKVLSSKGIWVEQVVKL